MAYDAKIMSAALRRFRADREERQAEQEKLTREIYRRLPRVERIDRELRGTAARIALAAFASDVDTDKALAELERSSLALQRERAELLVGAGYPYDCLDGAPSCGQCRDSGYLPDGSLCRCLKEYYTREQNRQLSKLLDLGNQSFETFSFDWYDTQVWPEFGRSPLKNMETVRNICKKYAADFSQTSGNLLFTGAPGLGKTFLSACIAREVSEREFSVVYDTASHVFGQFESGKFGRESPFEEDPDREINRYLNCDLLIMDDVGTEMTTSFVRAVFYRLVNDRLMNRKKTIISTNLPVERIGAQYGEAVLSRIRGEYRILLFFGRDIRILKSNMS